MSKKNQTPPIKNLDKFIEKIDNLKKQDKMDLSSDQDLTIAIMNLISIEEHFFFTGAKTGKKKYYQLLNQVREIRKELLQKIIKKYEGEVWCISKHLLAASMRLMEVGTKQQGLRRPKTARQMFRRAYDLYSLFWGLNLDLIPKNHIKKIAGHQLNKHDQSTTVPSKTATSKQTNRSFTQKLGDLVKKAIDCCIE
ncbi:MAG: hypothetical protein GF332_04315 [Candidatus Moranbacteria bacterium]|nr:hypothetical protein [Candidatus Moranbacteria bacterium]